MPFLLWGMVIDGYPFVSKYSFLAKLTYHGIPFKKKIGTSLANYWLGLHESTTGSLGLIPDQGTKIPCAAQQILPPPYPPGLLTC